MSGVSCPGGYSPLFSLSCSVRMLVSTRPVLMPSSPPSLWHLSQRISVETGATAVNCANFAPPALARATTVAS